MTADRLAKPENPLSDLDMQALRVIADHSREFGGRSSGINPSGLAYVLIEHGAIRMQHGRKRLRPQGAGFIGGRLIARLYRAGLVHSSWPEGAWVTIAGQRALASLQSEERVSNASA